jgi:tetratricopeptide (TPR) repeat protein
MTTHNILIIVLLCACTTAFGQYADHYERSALASYYSKDYKTAMLFSEKVLELDSRNITSLFVAGESARMIQDFEKAEYYLEQIPDNAKAGYFGITDFRLASVKEILGKKQEAERYYRKYLEERDSDTDLLALLAREALEMLDKGITTSLFQGCRKTSTQNCWKSLHFATPTKFILPLFIKKMTRPNLFAGFMNHCWTASHALLK